MTELWTCEAPEHEGVRFNIHPLDRFTRRQTFMRADGKQRLHEQSVGRICRACIELEQKRHEQIGFW